MRARAAVAALMAVLLTVLGFAAPASAVSGSTVTLVSAEAGGTVTTTNINGRVKVLSQGMTARNVATFCPTGGDSWFMRVTGPAGTTRTLAAGECYSPTKSGKYKVALKKVVVDPPPPPGDWPTAANTGFQGDASALPQRNGWRVTTPGTVVENVRIDTSDGALVIDAPNVTVRNVVIDAGIWGIDALHTADGLTVEDSTIIGGLQAGIGLDPTGGDLTGWTLQRLNMHSGNDAIKPSGQGVIRDNYLHDLGQIGTDPHNDAMQFGDVDGVLVQHNRMECRDTSCIAMFEGQATFRNVTIDNNHMTGAGYIIYAGGNTGYNIRITNNVFGNWGWPNGWVTDWVDKPGNVWSGNTDLNGNTLNP